MQVNALLGLIRCYSHWLLSYSHGCHVSSFQCFEVSHQMKTRLAVQHKTGMDCIFQTSGCHQSAYVGVWIIVIEIPLLPHWLFQLTNTEHLCLLLCFPKGILLLHFSQKWQWGEIKSKQEIWGNILFLPWSIKKKYRIGI